jgi:hypothetical protein
MRSRIIWNSENRKKVRFSIQIKTKNEKGGRGGKPNKYILKNIF